MYIVYVLHLVSKNPCSQIYSYRASCTCIHVHSLFIYQKNAKIQILTHSIVELKSLKGQSEHSLTQDLHVHVYIYMDKDASNFNIHVHVYKGSGFVYYCCIHTCTALLAHVISDQSKSHGQEVLQEILGISRTTLGDDGMRLHGVTVILERGKGGEREGGN